uniref:Hikeshi-like domain-containing protein n=2 Tax=Sar TaxID=2698737 RepID=A0A7S2TES9_PROMC|mmetsp:Transcript_6546/g.8316  ORF Transcript_6546/g.8316 Transcript_6546/m.8316 type:complete len:215 (-) Transcript_6546:947-1591(-)|eukprot:CAMPEP_0204845352 /NCGR_PEP_ID=MMETSP1347-20130617/1086_1 /ASSEMBLY_ACC=CAM_ASM_000690 /TAXON_ID=215587 /ORGANISM="Aplanochytrium stocchinoi, Strain GSBS06" /LENGTH=214 /DNA_ID=CAMNT_0051985357 /DNA_START=163 /DNA_END=807 /DNA_ORIENTATION=-
MAFSLGNLSLPNPGANGPIQQQPQLNISAGNLVNNVCGVLCPGRPVIIEWHQVESTKLITDLPNPGLISDLSFFLLPGATVPPNTAMALYYSVPPFQMWNILGSISDVTPSATFSTGWETNPDFGQASVVRLGVSIEPLDTITNLEQSKSIKTSQDRMDWGLKLAQDLYEFMGSYSQTTSFGEQLVVPANVLDRWMARFKAKYSRDPNFLLKNK